MYFNANSSLTGLLPGKKKGCFYRKVTGYKLYLILLVQTVARNTN